MFKWRIAEKSVKRSRLRWRTWVERARAVKHIGKVRAHDVRFVNAFVNTSLYRLKTIFSLDTSCNEMRNIVVSWSYNRRTVHNNSQCRFIMGARWFLIARLETITYRIFRLGFHRLPLLYPSREPETTLCLTFYIGTAISSYPIIIDIHLPPS